MQSLEQEFIEVLLINDGSTDGSLEICQQYADIYDNFKVFSKENEGLSATRNFGIKRAKGKYIAYLDSDDKYSPDTLKNVCDFFDCNYREIDMVTIPIVKYQRGKALKLHYRYQYLVNTGIYDLNEVPFISQTNINIIVKNKKEKNILFDTTPNFRHEDQKYNNDIIALKMKIGYVKEAEYKYNRDNEASITSIYMYPYYIFETTLNYFENLFDNYERVPLYFQALYINDLEWKLCDDRLFPFHYSNVKWHEANQRIKKLLSRCDYEVIVSHPTIDNFHVQYWLNMKPNVFPVIVAQNNRVDIVVEGKSIYYREYFEIIVHKIRVKNGKLRMLGFVKSPIYNYIEESANVWVIENDVARKKLDVFQSIHSFYKTRFTRTNKFYAFDYYCNVAEVREFHFEIELDGIFYQTKYWCMPVAVFDLKNKVDHYIRENTLLTLSNNKMILQEVNDLEIDEIEHKANQKYYQHNDIYSLRERALRYRKEHKIWLYYDAYTVRHDNGYYQFINDIRHCASDGIERYYVVTNEESKEMFSEEEKKYLVKFGSKIHKLLYLCCRRVFTAFYGLSMISPFITEKEEANYLDLIKFETIYLQHGVLHAALHTYNAIERCRAEKIVVSSRFEIENYMKNYNYKISDLIPTGMARYDLINRDKAAENKILYAPSWRKYLTFSKSESNWTVVAEKLKNSEYFIKMIEFINNKQLEKILEDNDLWLEIKLHPIIAKDTRKLLNITSKRVLVAGDDIYVEDYKMFITDFSSYVFDYACLNRPILYYVTDYMQFKSGMNHYKELDLPFEKAFGLMVTESLEAVAEIEKIINREFIPEEVYSERMNSFYFPLDNCRERLYEYIIKNDKV